MVLYCFHKLKLSLVANLNFMSCADFYMLDNVQNAEQGCAGRIRMIVKTDSGYSDQTAFLRFCFVNRS